MSIIKKYFDYQNKYEELYGKDKTIVLMQVGSFHEAYSTKDKGYDLRELSNILNMVVSRKDKSITEISLKNPEMLGFPSIALPKYLEILVNSGYTVIIIDQVTPPPYPKRKVTGIYSSGTYIENQKSADSNYIVSLYIEEEKQMVGKTLLVIGLSCIDLSTGKNIVHETYSVKNDDKYALDEASRFIKTYSPKEILINTKLRKENEEKKKKEIIMYLELDNLKYIYNNNIDKNFKKISYQQEFLNKIFKNPGMLSVLEYLDLEKKPYSVISYIILLDFAYNHDNNIVNNIYKPITFQNNKHLILGNNAINQLNILRTDSLETKNKKYQSLFDVINQTSTSIGRRYLKESLLNPIINENDLSKRYDLIEELIKDDLYLIIEENLKKINDIERLQRKFSLKVLHPMEFQILDNSYLNIKKLIKLLKTNDLFNNIILNETDYKMFKNFRKKYKKIFIIEEMNKYLINDIYGSILKQGYCIEIDEIQNEIDSCVNFMENFRLELEKYIKDNHIKKKSLKSDFNKIYLKSNERDGHFLCLTKLRSEALKKELKKIKYLEIGKEKIETEKIVFKDLSKGNTKIFLPDMNKKSEKVVFLKDKMKNMLKKKYIEIKEELYNEFGYLFKLLTDFVGFIDFLKSGAKVALLFNYCKPKIIKKNKSFIQAKNLRHPIVERIQNETEYIPNDINLGCNKLDGILLYGLNSSGKTVLMKSVGISIILAQCGLYVPCKEFKFYPYHSLYARITGNDNIFKGLSSFELEMTELRAILKRANKNTLVIGDEICRGTEDVSSNSIVSAAIITLSRIESSFIFASHLHDIPKMDRIKKLENIKSYHLKVDYDKEKDRLIFNRKLNEGSGQRVYGLIVAKYLIHNDDFIKLAEKIKKEILNEYEQILPIKKSQYNKNLYIDECKICHEKQLYDGSLDTHHINFQKDCLNGFSIKKEYIRKNDICNLVVLCKSCHKKVHQDKIQINGYVDTSNGKVLDYKIKNQFTPN